VNASLGVSSSSSKSSSHGKYAHVGVMQAGRDVELTAGRDLDIEGTQIEAARFLVADGATTCAFNPRSLTSMSGHPRSSAMPALACRQGLASRG
jgi:hypothetical protein